MAMNLGKVVPLGRSLDEYRKMFNLTHSDLEKRIIGVGDGPASFNAEMNQIDKRVISIDPLYVFNGEAIKRQFYRVIDDVIEQVKQTYKDWTWTYHKSPDDLKTNRIKALKNFLCDYEKGKVAGRYIVAELPNLGSKDEQFDLALCSHFLFLYSDHFDYSFHRESLYEMLRIATEVRVFPLLSLALNASHHLKPLARDLKKDGFWVKIEKVDYELQRGGNEMLRIGRCGPSSTDEVTTQSEF